METKLDTTNSERCGLPTITEKLAPHRRVDLKVAPTSDWPDGDWYTPCEAECADFSDDLILELARSYATIRSSARSLENSLQCGLLQSAALWAIST
jgi:hypothetical protein